MRAGTRKLRSTPVALRPTLTIPSPTIPYRKRRGTVPSRQLLVQLDYDSDLRFDVGDAAALYLTIPKADLRAGRFNRVDGEMQES